MNRTGTQTLSCLLIILLIIACQPIQPEAATPALPQPMEKIRNAVSAAPLAIAQDATIIDWPAKSWGDLVVLRQGTNGWTCFPDDPGNPINDPMCLDKMWMVWLEAVMMGTEPHYTAPGIAYMLQGGSDPSNTDPYLMEPPAGQTWNITPPHLMLVFPGKLDPTVFSTDPNSREPYIMYQDTPYEHLMVPVEAMNK